MFSIVAIRTTTVIWEICGWEICPVNAQRRRSGGLSIRNLENFVTYQSSMRNYKIVKSLVKMLLVDFVQNKRTPIYDRTHIHPYISCSLANCKTYQKEIG